jgi:peptidoglycan hydrolase-like protein with peptidoglycan-binding domain
MSVHKGFTWPLYTGLMVTVLALLLGLGPAQAAFDGSQVREAQKILRELQYDPGPIDGILGIRTRGAILQFQRDHGLELTRSPDETTMRWLRNMREAPASEPAPQPPPPQPNETSNETVADTPEAAWEGQRAVIRERLPIPPVEKPSIAEPPIPGDGFEPPVPAVEQSPVPVEAAPEQRPSVIGGVQDTQGASADRLAQGTEEVRDRATPAPSSTQPVADNRGWLLLVGSAVAIVGLVAIAALRKRRPRKTRRNTAGASRKSADRKGDAWEVPFGETADHATSFEDETDPIFASRATAAVDTDETATLQVHPEASSETMVHDEYRARPGSEDETKILTSMSPPETYAERAAADIAESEAAIPSDEDSSEIESEEGIATEEDDEPGEDPLAEINIKLAFEQYEQAEELIKEAIEKYPHRHEYVLRLLEVYHAMREPLAFEYYAKMLQRTAGEKSPLLERAIVWWQDLCPERDLFVDAPKEKAPYELAQQDSRGF